LVFGRWPRGLALVAKGQRPTTNDAEMKSRELTTLERAIGHRFRRPELLEMALTHTSHAHELASRAENGGNHVAHNEQLEFLGDAVLGLITSAEIFGRFPSYQEGQLSKLRAHLVSERHLIRAANQLDLGHFLRLGRGEEKSGGRAKPALLVDALEAVLGAMYLDGGFEDARRFVIDHVIEPELARVGADDNTEMPLTDFKSALQERAHALGRAQPDYVLIQEEGPEHQKTFTVEARIRPVGRTRPEHVSRAKGTTKKRAEQEAARLALDFLVSAEPIEPEPEPEPEGAESRNMGGKRASRR
jgi:ribonuclease III